MTYINLIYLGLITDRVPVIAMFTPSHIAPAPTMAFGEVFDVPRFSRDSGMPLLEWKEVKDPNSEVVDDLGCWNVWEAVQYYEHYPRGSSLTDWLKLGAWLRFFFSFSCRPRPCCRGVFRGMRPVLPGK